ncbi:hypothetical protein [Siccirubricoccus phaeus]|uniref:hypothetical protein n=1 Tax=Siccirubricoccus phaeus TaxID=2595053 RepID=UPI00165BCE67|nr:hypothetical protein [Siccirubricoccus phaeus]
MWVRAILVVAGALAALVVARDAPNFLVVEAMVAVVLIAAVVGLLALLNRRR